MGRWRCNVNIMYTWNEYGEDWGAWRSEIVQLFIQYMLCTQRCFLGLCWDRKRTILQIGILYCVHNYNVHRLLIHTCRPTVYIANLSKAMVWVYLITAHIHLWLDVYCIKSLTCNTYSEVLKGVRTSLAEAVSLSMDSNEALKQNLDKLDKLTFSRAWTWWPLLFGHFRGLHTSGDLCWTNKTVWDCETATILKKIHLPFFMLEEEVYICSESMNRVCMAVVPTLHISCIHTYGQWSSTLLWHVLMVHIVEVHSANSQHFISG